MTGAFGFTGGAITARLIDAGRDVVTLTRRPWLPNPFGERLRVAEADYERPAAMVTALEGADCLYNTTWLRFERGDETFREAVERTAILMQAARQAGVQRVVHISVCRADPGIARAVLGGQGTGGTGRAGERHPMVDRAADDPLGPSDILYNNMAWFLRRFPAFVLPVRGDVIVQPVHVEDVAALCIESASGPSERTMDAAGPERLSFRAMVEVVRDAVGSRTRILPLPPALGLAASRVMGAVVRDRVLTRDEVRALDLGLLASTQPPTGHIAFTAWAADSADELGCSYHSELARNYRTGPSR